MKTKRWLVIVPVALLLLFLQSPFWVPNYESQAELGEGRSAVRRAVKSGCARVLKAGRERAFMVVSVPPLAGL